MAPDRVPFSAHNEIEGGPAMSKALALFATAALIAAFNVFAAPHACKAKGKMVVSGKSVDVTTS
jgi:hypothetical protein